MFDEEKETDEITQHIYFDSLATVLERGQQHCWRT